jgi:hypothetical protein
MGFRLEEGSKRANIVILRWVLEELLRLDEILCAIQVPGCGSARLWSGRLVSWLA